MEYLVIGLAISTCLAALIGASRCKAVERRALSSFVTVAAIAALGLIAASCRPSSQPPSSDQTRAQLSNTINQLNVMLGADHSAPAARIRQVDVALDGRTISFFVNKAYWLSLQPTDAARAWLTTNASVWDVLHQAGEWPEKGVVVRLVDSNGAPIKSQLLSKRPTEKEISALDRGAYDVLKHWDIPCGGKGGFGEWVLIRSHKAVDLIAAYRDFIADVGTGSDQCVSLFAFATTQTKAEWDNPDITDAEFNDYEAHSLQYFNNPNADPSAYEFLRGPDGVVHKMRGG